MLETLSDIIQVGYFKLTHGKRFFKMAPLHHHLELSGWSEAKLVAVFSLVTLVCCVLAYLGVQGRFLSTLRPAAERGKIHDPRGGKQYGTAGKAQPSSKPSGPAGAPEPGRGPGPAGAPAAQREMEQESRELAKGPHRPALLASW